MAVLVTTAVGAAFGFIGKLEGAFGVATAIDTAIANIKPYWLV